MNKKIITGFIIIAVSVGLYLFSNNMKNQVIALQQKMNMVESNSQTPPALIERPANRMRQAKAQGTQEKTMMIGERTLDQYEQLITLVQATSGVLFVAGIAVALFGIIPSRKK